MSVYCFQNICMLFSFQSLRKDHQIHLRHLHHLRQIYIYIYMWRNLLTLTTLRRIISMPVLLTTWKLMNLSIKTFTKLSISSSWRFQIHSCRSGNVASKYKYTCCGLMDIWLNLSIFIFTNWAPWWISSSGSPSHRWLYFVISTWNTESCQAHFFLPQNLCSTCILCTTCSWSGTLIFRGNLIERIDSKFSHNIHMHS